MTANTLRHTSSTEGRDCSGTPAYFNIVWNCFTVDIVTGLLLQKFRNESVFMNISAINEVCDCSSLFGMSLLHSLSLSLIVDDFILIARSSCMINIHLCQICL